MAHMFTSADRKGSTVQHKKELSNAEHDYIGKELANSEQIDVLSAMQDGTKLLKLCSRRTRSHWRKFQLDATNTSIRWVSDKKDVTDTTIHITNIIEIICHSINIVKKFKDTLPEEINNNLEALQQQQFTIRYLEHNKNYTNYLPSLSPNTSSYAITNQSNSNIVQQPGGHHIHHQPSSSFIRTLSFKQPQGSTLDHIEDSATDSSSNKDNNDHNNTGAFWKSWGRNKHDKKMDKSEQPTLHIHNHLRQNSTDSLKIPQGTLSSSRDNYHIQDLHLIAETSKVATIWIYGLERLIELNRRNVDLSTIPSSQFQISVKELMNYSINNRVHHNNMLDYKRIFAFKERLDEITTALYHIIEQMPSHQQQLLEDMKRIPSNNPLIKKVRQDQNDLDYILHQVSKARFDKENLKRWGYILTRIEVNFGGYQIAVHNQKQRELNPSKYESRHPHKRQRSQSSTVHSLYGAPKFNLRQNSNSAFQRSGGQMLKNRTPRSPRNQTQFKAEEIAIVHSLSPVS
eukprot:65751_1